MRILISDAISHNRENLASYLVQSGLVVVGTAATGEQTVKLVGELKPDVLILDSNLPDVDALELVNRFAQLEDGPTVILLSVSRDRLFEQRGLQAGAFACLAKNEGIDPLIDAIQKIQIINFEGE